MFRLLSAHLLGTLSLHSPRRPTTSIRWCALLPLTLMLALTACGGGSSSSTSGGGTAPMVTLTLSAQEIVVGQTSVLSWSAHNADTCNAAGDWNGSQATSGSVVLAPTTAGHYHYQLNCQGADQTTTANIDLLVDAAPSSPTLSMHWSQDRVTTGQSATLSWTSTDAQSCTASGAWTGGRDTTGTFSVTPTIAGTYTYTLACDGTGSGEISQSAVLSVSEPSASPPAITLYGSYSQMTVGDTVTIHWSTANASACAASGAWNGPKALSGAEPSSPLEPGSYTYSLECSGTGGSTRADYNLEVRAAPPSVSISVSPLQVEVGQAATLTWSSTGAQTCSASADWSGAKSANGTEAVSPATEGSFSYVITCQGPGGQGTASTSLTVVPGAPPPPKPAIQMSLSSSNIIVGTDAMLSWTTTGADSCTSTGAWSGYQPTAGTAAVSPLSAGSYAYTLICSGTGGESRQSVDLVAYEPPIITPAQPSKGHVGAGYSQPLTVINGTGTYEWSVVAGALPPGIRLSAEGALLGTPSTSGSSSFTVQARSADGEVVKRILRLAVASASCPMPGVQPADPASQSEWQWTSIGEPTVSAPPVWIRVDPEDVNVMYLGTKTGLYASRDAGQTWALMLSSTYSVSVEFEPGNSCNVYALTSVGSVYALSKSADRGRTWSKLKDGMKSTPSMLVSRTTPNLILVSSRTNGDPSLYDGFFRSTDDGVTWSFVKVDGGSRGLIFWDIHEDVDGVIYSGSEIYDHPQPYAPQLFRSRDAGISWEDVTGPLWWHVTSIQSDPDKAIVYAMQEGSQIYKTSDSGDHWNLASPGAGVLEFVLNPSKPNEFYAGRILYEPYGLTGGMHASTDRGVSFELTGLSGIGMGGLSLALSNRVLYAVGGDGAIWRSVIPTQ